MIGIFGGIRTILKRWEKEDRQEEEKKELQKKLADLEWQRLSLKRGMLQCTICGAQVDYDAKFCTRCGTPVKIIS